MSQALKKCKIKTILRLVQLVHNDPEPALQSPRQRSLLLKEIKDPLFSYNLLFYSCKHFTTSAAELLHIRVMLTAFPFSDGYRVHSVEKKQGTIIQLKAVWQHRCITDWIHTACVTLIPVLPIIWILAFAKLFLWHNTHV